MPCSGAMHSYLVHELYGSTCRGLKSINQFQIIPEASETVCQKKNSDPKNCTIENFRLKKKNNYYGGGRKGDVRCEPCSLLPACSDWVQRLIYSFCIHSRSLEPPTRTYLFFFFHSGIHHAVDTHAALRKYVPYLSCASPFFSYFGRISFSSKVSRDDPVRPHIYTQGTLRTPFARRNGVSRKRKLHFSRHQHRAPPGLNKTLF